MILLRRSICLVWAFKRGYQASIYMAGGVTRCWIGRCIAGVMLMVVYVEL